MLTTKSANAECCSRPADERFTSIASILENALTDKRQCVNVDVPLSDMEAIDYEGSIAIRNRKSGKVGVLTNWSASQLAKLGGAPFGYLQTLSVPLAVDCLNYGIGQKAAAYPDPFAVYVRRPVDALGDKAVTVRAMVTKDYTRLHDATVIESLNRLIDVRPSLELPPTWDTDVEGANIKGGAYRGDRDSFIILVDGGSIVNDPTIGFGGSNGTMYRGIIVRNSEVGYARAEVLTFLFRGICGNHCIWGVEDEVRTASRHVGDIGLRFDQMIASATKFFDRPESEDVDRIKALSAVELGKDRDEVVTAGRSLGLTLDQADTAYDMAERFEPNPRSVWGFAQGITRVSQSASYADDRFALDMVAAKLLRRRIAAL